MDQAEGRGRKRTNTRRKFSKMKRSSMKSIDNSVSEMGSAINSKVEKKDFFSVRTPFSCRTM